MDVRLPDGTIIRGVPDGMSKSDLTAKLARNGYDVSGLGVAPVAAPKESPSVWQGMKNAASDALGFAGDVNRSFRVGAMGVPRGVKDVVDTGAELAASAYSPAEGQRVQAMNDQGKADFAKYSEGSYLAPVARIGGQVAATLPLTAAAGAGVTAVGLPRLGQAITSAGMNTGGKAGPGLVNALQDLALRSAGGATSGYIQAGAVDPNSANTGAAIGGAIPLVAPVAKAVGWAGKKALGATTGVGDNALSEAFKAGKAGGAQSKSLAQNMRGEVPIEDALTIARQNLDEIGRQKSAAYREGMARLKTDKTVLDLSNITKTADDALGMSLYKGQVKNEPAAKVLQSINDEIMAWKQLDPADFHTPEGLDALKQRIGGIVESIPFEQKTARSAAGKVYTAIKSEITKQAPEYASVMKGYSESSDLIKEIERALSLGQKASADTSMRKLQSLMRNNVNTSYGYRTELAGQLEQLGGKQIMPALAGQSLNDWIPRGIQRSITGGGGAALTLTGNPLAAAGLAAVSSPRLMGEAAYLGGKAAQDNALTRAVRKGVYRAAPLVGTK